MTTTDCLTAQPPPEKRPLLGTLFIAALFVIVGFTYLAAPPDAITAAKHSPHDPSRRLRERVESEAFYFRNSSRLAWNDPRCIRPTLPRRRVFPLGEPGNGVPDHGQTPGAFDDVLVIAFWWVPQAEAHRAA